MTPQKVDIVLVIDASASMQPCIDSLRRHLNDLIRPLQGYLYQVRFGLVALSASDAGDTVLYRVRTLAGENTVGLLYGQQVNQYHFFSSDIPSIIKALDEIVLSGDEDNLMALDIAIDHPFGPISDTKRVIAVFTDEPIENGVDKGENQGRLNELIDKLHARRVKLFLAMPFSDGASRLAEANGSELEVVEGGDGLSRVDFSVLLTQMGKSISVSSLQASASEVFQRAIYGQDRWVDSYEPWNVMDNKKN